MLALHRSLLIELSQGSLLLSGCIWGGSDATCFLCHSFRLFLLVKGTRTFLVSDRVIRTSLTLNNLLKIQGRMVELRTFCSLCRLRGYRISRESSTLKVARNNFHLICRRKIKFLIFLSI